MKSSIVVVHIFLWYLSSCFVNVRATFVNKFTSYVLSNGQRVCANETGTEEFPIKSEISCGARCIARTSCLLFSYQKTIDKPICKLYHYRPASYSAIDGCVTYTLVSQLTPTCSPSIVVVEFGSSVTLKCSLNYQTTRWSFTPVGSSGIDGVIVAENCQVLDSYLDIYSTQIDDFQCSLLIGNINLIEAGNYTCDDDLSAAANQAASCEVMVLEYISKCVESSLGFPIYEEQEWTLSCAAHFNGEPHNRASLRWSDSEGNPFVNAQTTTGNSSQLTSTIRFRAFSPAINPFTCFIDITVPFSRDDSTPHTFTCTTERVPVIVLEPTCIDSSSSKVIVEEDNVSFTCTLDYVGNLKPNVTWYDCHGNEITNATNIFEQNIVISTIFVPAYLPFVSTFKFETWMPDAPDRLYAWNSTLITVNRQTVCPVEFQYLSSANGCYQVIFNAMNWSVSNEECLMLSENSYLASISGDIEQNAVANYLQEVLTANVDSALSCMYTPTPGFGRFVWIGGRTLDASSCQPLVWNFPLGETVPTDFSRWRDGQPDCPWTNEHCLHLWQDNQFRWNDVGCDNTFCALCEYGPW